jgi:propanol-preferring alcohol dehydrogenase
VNAIQLIQAGRPLELRQVPMPAPGPKDVLIRVKAAGICHSDAHYRAGVSPVHPLPLTLGHEVAGIVEEVGGAVGTFRGGERVCLHYLATCGECAYCHQGREQFCASGRMIGKHRDGGFAEHIVMPARSVFPLPDEIPFTQGAILMCSSSTALHALRQARLQPGESVAVFGVGGLGVSAVQLAAAMGADEVFAVDIKPGKLALAESFGATSINAAEQEPVATIASLTGGRGVDVALELIGLPLTMRQAVRSLAVGGRAALAGITPGNFEVAPYAELINKEAEIIGVSDHLARELPQLLRWTRQGKLSLAKVVTRTILLDAGAVNKALDRLGEFGDDVRVVVTPGG